MSVRSHPTPVSAALTASQLVSPETHSTRKMETPDVFSSFLLPSPPLHHNITFRPSLFAAQYHIACHTSQPYQDITILSSVRIIKQAILDQDPTARHRSILSSIFPLLTTKNPCPEYQTVARSSIPAFITPSPERIVALHQVLFSLTFSAAIC